MASVVRMPSVLAGATEAAIARWLVKPGEAVAAGDPIAEIETEKALVEYAAEEPGVLGRIVLAEGESGEIGVPIAVLTRDGETDADIDTALSGPGAGPGTAPVPGSAGHADDQGRGQAQGPSQASPAVPRARLFASPITRKIAAQKGIDLSAVTGTGPNGRIVRRDLDRLAGPDRRPGQAGANGARLEPEAAGSPTAAAPRSNPGFRGTDGGVAPQPPSAAAARPSSAAGTLVPHTALRRAIARRLTESKAATPHFYLTTDCVVDDLLELRTRVNQTAAVKVSVNDFVLMAVAAAFREVPEANVTWTDEGMLSYSSVDLSIAVATDGGLVTPVMRGVESRRLTEVAAEARELAQRARDRRLHQHELEGGVFSVSNLGMYGTREFSAIINPPQSAILAVGTATSQPVAVDGQVTVATVMRCTLSVDHRAIDGALAARWLAAFTTCAENPLSAII